MSHGFRSLPETLLIEHDARGEAEQFALLPEPWVDAIGPPAARANARKLRQRNHGESGRPNVFVPGLG